MYMCLLARNASVYLLYSSVQNIVKKNIPNDGYENDEDDTRFCVSTKS